MADPTSFGRFVWYDLMSADTEASKRFYTEALGWGTRVDRPLMGVEGRPPYTMWTAREVPIAGLVPMNETHWLGYVAVENVDRAVAQAKSLGSDLVFGPEEIPQVGRFAVISDPQATTVAVFQSIHGASPPVAPRVLEFSWHELATTDWRAAMNFYNAIFGWETISENDMGPLGTYAIFGLHGVPCGGMFDKSAAMPSAGCYYVRVHDVHDAANKVLQHAGQVIYGPAEVPGGGWIAHCRDVTGGLFAVHQIAARSNSG
jgi:uncharacterized protein